MPTSRFRRMLALAAVAAAFPALASFHLMKIVEVFPGTAAAPNAQYVVIQMYSAGQNFVDGQDITVFNASGVQVGSFIFAGNVGSGSNQAKILIATAEAQTFFSVTPDLTMTADMISAGGKVCFSGTIDCVSWGSYSGSTTGVGTPYNASVGLRSGKAAKRRLDISGSASVLDAGDDTNNSANDFIEALPAPRNNAGALGSVPAAVCGNGALEGLEECDDHNLVNGDGCSSTCLVTPLPPSLSVNDVTVTEGGSGTKLANFTVSLSAVSASPVGFDIATAPGTAMPDQDYVSQALLGQSIAAGQTSANFAVTINGDPQVENNETYTVNLANVSGATVADGQGLGTITNDDNPILSIADVTLPEGNSGNSTASFAIRLSAPTTRTVSFQVATANGTATAVSGDFILRIEGKVIDPGRTRATFEVAVVGDTTVETDETFAVNISNVTNAILADGSAVGTIQNDDVAPVPIAQIQGEGLISPMAGKLITTRGVVTARTKDGFFLQSLPAEADDRPTTSEGLFVSSAQSASAVGDIVRVRGQVREVQVGDDPDQLSLTELAADDVAVLDRGQPQPAEITIDSRMAGPDAGVAALERFEGMRVKFDRLLVVAPVTGAVDSAGRVRADGRFYGVVAGLPRPFREPGLSVLEPQVVGAGVGPVRFDSNPERLQIDSAAQRGASMMAVDAGQMVAGLEGVLAYGDGSYRILPDPAAVLSVTGNTAPRAVPLAAQGELTIGSLSLRSEHAAQQGPGVGEAASAVRVAKTAAAICGYLHGPDILGVTGIEGTAAFAALAQAIGAGPDRSKAVAACEGITGYRKYSQGQTGFLVRSGSLPSGTPHVEVDGVIALDPTEKFRNRDGSREGLHQTAPLLLKVRQNLQSGATRQLLVLLAVLSPLEGDLGLPGTHGWATRAEYLHGKRRAQAMSLARWVRAHELAHPGETLVLLADLDSSEFDDGSGNISALVSGAASPGVPPLRNLTPGLPENERYTVVRAGNALAVDHVFVNRALLDEDPGLHLDIARLNADFGADSENDVNVPMRFGSHDPSVLYLH